MTPCTCDAECEIFENQETKRNEDPERNMFTLAAERMDVRCKGCGATWNLRDHLSATGEKFIASETKRLGVELTPWQKHSIHDMCYFKTLAPGPTCPPGGTKES